MSEYSFMSVNLDDAVTPVIVADGKECQVQVIEAEANAEKCYVKLRMKPVGVDGFVKSFNHFLFFPKPEDDSEKRNNKLCSLRDFNTAFGISGPVTDPAAYVGTMGWAIIGIEESAQYGQQNQIKKLSVSK